jgi:putative spermidine/putrescine transport system permease protein
METRLVTWWLKATVVFVGFWLIVPVLIVIPLSFAKQPSFAFPPKELGLNNYVKFFTDSRWIGSFSVSVRLAFVVAIISTVLGVLASFGLTRGRYRGKSAIQGLLLLPIVTPGIVVAIAVYALFIKMHIVGSWLAFILAHTLIALPFVIVTVSSALSTFDRKLELAAASLGANPLNTMLRVTLPVIRPGILSGAVFAFVTSFDEVVVALFIQSPTLRTLPTMMWQSVTSEIDPTIAAASTLVIVVTTILILTPQLARRSSSD